MTSNPTSHLSQDDLVDIRDAVPTLDLLAIRSLRRAGFQIVRNTMPAERPAASHPGQNPEWQPQTNNAA